MASDPALFRMISLFEDASDARLAEIAATCSIGTHHAGAEVLGDLEQTNDVFFILRGRLRINSFTPAGREVIFSDLFAGDIFGEFAAIDGLPRSASVVAIDECLVARMTSERFFHLLQSDGTIATKLIESLVAKIRRLSARVFEVSALSVRERVRRELLRLAELGTRNGSGITIQPAPTHYEFAARIGSHREAVTREFNRLEALGVLRSGRQQIQIIALSALENAVEE